MILKKGYPSIDKPWLKYYSEKTIHEELPHGTMYDYLMSENRKYPDSCAYEYSGTKKTYRELDEEITKASKALWHLGIREGDVISLCLPAVPEFVHILYAANRIGAVCNFIAINATEDIILSELNNTGTRVFFCMNQIADGTSHCIRKTKVTSVIRIPLNDSLPVSTSFPFGLKRMTTGTQAGLSWHDMIKESEQEVPIYASSDENRPAIIEYTSGTTGEPKGALHTNRSANASAFNFGHMDDLVDLKRGDSFLDILPPFYAYGVFTGVHMPLCMGLKLILCPDSNPEHFGEQFLKYRPNHFSGGPLHIENLARCLEIQKSMAPYLKTAAFGGDSVTEEWEKEKDAILRKHGVRHGLIKGYGMTEMAGSFGTYTHKYPYMIPFCRNNVRVIDPETGRELEYGKEGEICLSGPSMMSCYFNMPKETSEAIWEENGERWLHSGDLGYVLENGQFVISGRLKRIYWAVGDKSINRVYPMRIENVICSHPSVDRCAVVGRKNDRKGYLSTAFVVKKGDETEEKIRSELVRLCIRKLEDTSRPVEFVFVDHLPYTNAGKVDYDILEQKIPDDVWEDSHSHSKSKHR